MVLGGMQSLACAGEPVAERGGATGGGAPEPAATAEQRKTEGGSPEGKSGLADKMRALIAETDSAAAANTALMTFYSDGLSKYHRAVGRPG